MAHVHSITGGVTIEWRAIKGYDQLLRTFLYQTLKQDHYIKPLLDAIQVLLLCDLGNNMNIFMRLIFSRTRAFSVMAIIDCLNTFESWMKELRTNNLVLPASFDINYLCKAIDVVLETDHHQSILKMLSFIYNNSDLFEGDARRKLFCDFLIKERFFQLFLHWDDAVRNSFQQMIVFKALRVKRSVLHSQGKLHIHELSGKEMGSSQEAVPSEDQDNFLDAILFSKIEAYVKMVQEQLRDPSFNIYPKSLEVYAPQALSDYKVYLSRYYQWERDPNAVEAPKLTPLHILQSAEVDNL